MFIVHFARLLDVHVQGHKWQFTLNPHRLIQTCITKLICQKLTKLLIHVWMVSVYLYLYRVEMCVMYCAYMPTDVSNVEFIISTLGFAFEICQKLCECVWVSGKVNSGASAATYQFHAFNSFCLLSFYYRRSRRTKQYPGLPIPHTQSVDTYTRFGLISSFISIQLYRKLAAIGPLTLRLKEHI